MDNLLYHLRAAEQAGQAVCADRECEGCEFDTGDVACVPAVLGRLIKRLEAANDGSHDYRRIS